MRSAQYITPVDEDEAFVHGFDLAQIDSPSPYSFWRLKYLERIDAILRAVRRY